MSWRWCLKMEKYNIKLVGCDDVTVVEMELDEREFKVIFRLAELSHEKSGYGCMPVLKIDGYKMKTEYD